MAFNRFSHCSFYVVYPNALPSPINLHCAEYTQMKIIIFNHSFINSTFLSGKYFVPFFRSVQLKVPQNYMYNIYLMSQGSIFERFVIHVDVFM